MLEEGSFDLPAAAAFGDAGFHETLTASTTAVASAGPGRLVLALRDLDRPDQTCDQEHPLSGCATVDWSDAEDRPNVPDGGVFDNHVTLDVAGETTQLFLSESDALTTVPDQFSPA